MQSSFFLFFFSQASRWPVCTAATEFVRNSFAVALCTALAFLGAPGAVNANDERTIIPISTGESRDISPEIAQIRSTPRGYVIIGYGFGGDPSAVTVYENDTPVPEESIVGVSSTRISVFSIPEGRTGVSVNVRGVATPANYFTHIEPPARDEQLADTDDTTRPVAFNAVQNTASRTTAKTIKPTPASAGDDGYLARELLRLRDRVSSLEQELSLMRQQLGISQR